MILFKNASLIDGSGKAAFKAHVLVDGKSISRIYKDTESVNVKGIRSVDLSGMVLCPGFIDMHAHSDLEILRRPSMPMKVRQGITTDISGNCGVGVFPRRPDEPSYFQDIIGHYDAWDWTDASSYFSRVKGGMNMGLLQNHAMLRIYAIDGNPNRKADKKEVSIMCSCLEKSLEQGCFGLSSGLYYAPCLFADRYEMTELLKVVKNADRIFAVHHRCEGTGITDSVEEILELQRQTGVRLEVSHLKAIGKENQQYVPQVLQMLHRSREEGYDTLFDQYPYVYGSTSLFSLLPPRYLRLEKDELSKTLLEAAEDSEKCRVIAREMANPDGWDSITRLCGFDSIKATVLDSSPEFCGLTLSQCAEKLGKDPYSALFTILGREKGAALMADITQSQEALEMIMKDPLMCFGTDALFISPDGRGEHPRSGNAAVQFLSVYCLEKKLFSLEEAVRRMSSETAARLRLKNRGLVKEGYRADLVVFDPETLKDNSTPEDPFKEITGIRFVMVNGELAVDEGSLTGSLSGEIIRN
ncbi:MAG: amidohydrolase family protein [Sphaerochaetaceae bacterium]|nr:amidohydrolase family protein [Sphaerochaetaceae bacterium]